MRLLHNYQRLFNEMEKIIKQKNGALYGLAIGDALSWPAMFQRSFQLPFWTRRKRREMDAEAEINFTLNLTLPYSLNQNADHFNLYPTNNTEWVAFTIQQLMEYGNKPNAGNWVDGWKSLINPDRPLRASIAIKTALANLNKGKMPPESGHDNPHYFDDSAMSRAIPIGLLFHGDHEKLMNAIVMDASVTNSEDGIWAAQSIAVAVSIALKGGAIENIISNAIEVLPSNSWSKRVVTDALNICDQSNSFFDATPALTNQIINREYSYGSAAPEILAITLSVLYFSQNSFEKAISMATTIGKTAETVPALVGALAGALDPDAIDSKVWTNHLKQLKGISIPKMKNVNYIDLVNAFVNQSA